MIGPDAARYLHAARGGAVPRPFHIRRLLPAVCGTVMLRWWLVWGLSWPVLAASMVAWQSAHGWQIAATGAVLLVGLPGILGPSAVIPVGVDLPATALALAGVAIMPHSLPVGVALVAVAAGCKETAPVFAALWAWSLWPLVALVVPAVLAFKFRPGPDPLGGQFQRIADHPIVTAFEARLGRWRDGFLLVAPWGACMAALYAPSWPLVAVLLVAYLQLLVATDTVRLVQHAAGPVMAASAAHIIPTPWLFAAVVFHVVWWGKPERI